MITIKQAEQLALEHIKPSVDYIKKTLVDDDIVIEHSIEFPDCWIFFLNSKSYLETHNIFRRLLGGAPVIVGKENGDVYQGVSGSTVETWLNEFREFLRGQNTQNGQSGEPQ